MPQTKISKLTWKHWSIMIATLIASLIAHYVCTKYFHLGHSDWIMLMFIAPVMIGWTYVCRNLQRKPFGQEVKETLATLLGILLTFWIPLVILAVIFHINVSNHDYQYLLGCPEYLVFLISLFVFGTWALALIILLRKLLGYSFAHK